MTTNPFHEAEAILFDVLHTLVDDDGFPRYQLRDLLAAGSGPGGGIDDLPFFEEIYRELTEREYDWEAAAAERPFRSIRDRHRSRLTALYRHFGLDRHRDLEADIAALWAKIGTCTIYPEVAEVLAALAGRGYRLALVSNADRDDPVLGALERAGLGVDFAAVVTSQGAGAYKPAPAIFVHALRELALEPAQVVMVGDSPASDILGARRAGMTAVWVNRKGRTYPPGYPEPQAAVPDLKGLLELFPGPGRKGEEEAAEAAAEEDETASEEAEMEAASEEQNT